LVISDKGGWASKPTTEELHAKEKQPAKKKIDDKNSKTPTIYGEGSCVVLPVSVR
jgi:hypothetical protein